MIYLFTHNPISVYGNEQTFHYYYNSIDGDYYYIHNPLMSERFMVYKIYITGNRYHGDVVWDDISEFVIPDKLEICDPDLDNSERLYLLESKKLQKIIDKL
jgi:hypothetical protein